MRLPRLTSTGNWAEDLGEMILLVMWIAALGVIGTVVFGGLFVWQLVTK